MQSVSAASCTDTLADHPVVAQHSIRECRLLYPVGSTKRRPLHNPSPALRSKSLRMSDATPIGGDWVR